MVVLVNAHHSLLQSKNLDRTTAIRGLRQALPLVCFLSADKEIPCSFISLSLQANNLKRYLSSKII